MNKPKICRGCGAVLQTIDPAQPGYIPSNVEMERENPLCQRCFKLRHYNENSIIIGGAEFLKKIDIPTKNNIILYVVDAFNFYGSLLPHINEYATKGNKLIIVVNKIDVLPKSLNVARYKVKITRRLREMGVNFVDCQIISARTNEHFDDLLRKIIEIYPEKNIYLIGAANVGKSSIINKLLKNYHNQTTEMVTTSYFPGTTLQLVKIPFLNDKYLYDTPGLFNPENIYRHVNNKNLKYLLPTKEIKPRVYQLKSAQSLYLGSLCRVDYLANDKKAKASFVVYAGGQVVVTRAKLDENAETKFNRAIENAAYYPKARDVSEFADLQRNELLLNKTADKTSIYINGLGIIDVIGRDAKIAVYLPEGVGITVSAPFTGSL